MYVTKDKEGKDKVYTDDMVYLVLEKFNNTGEFKIVPREFTSRDLALEWIAETDKSFKNYSETRAKNIKYYLLRLDKIEMVT